MRIISLFISIMMIVVIAGTAEAATLSVSNASGVPGDKVSVTVSVALAPGAETDAGVAGVAFTIKYNTYRLTLTGVKSSYFDTFPSPVEGYSQAIVTNTVSGVGTSIAAARTTAGGPGTLFTLDFTIKDTAPAGDCTINIAKTIPNNPDAGWNGTDGVPMIVGALPDTHPDFKDLAKAFPVTADLAVIQKGTITVLADTDDDGLADSVETNTGIYVSPSDTGTNPGVADTDGDGLKDGAEVSQYATNPTKWDSDGDGFSDGEEISQETDPNETEERHIANFDGLNGADILWRNLATGRLTVWLMNGKVRTSSGSPGILASEWKIEELDDFDNDGKTDILFYNATTGQVVIWLMDGVAVKAGGTGSPGTLPDLNWKIQGTGNFDGVNGADILWRHKTTGRLNVWLIGPTGKTRLSSASPGLLAPAWKIKKVVDFDNDGKADILFYNATNGQVVIWLMNGVAVKASGTGSPGTLPDLEYQIEDTGNFDGLNGPDILWRHKSTGRLQVWLIAANGKSKLSGASPGLLAPEWKLLPSADLNNDGKSDLVFYKTTSGQVTVWLMNGSSIADQGSAGSLPDLNWQIQDVCDFSAAGKADILWHHQQTGKVYIWLMNGKTKEGEGSPGSLPDLNWKIQ
jgi:hypothetical protein